MDTRTKIVPRQQVGVRPDAVWIAGHFDPLLAEHVRWLEQAREPGRLLVVEVTNSGEPLLPQRARAELVAALAMVDFVVLGERQSAEDSGISEQFMRHVLERHRRETRRQGNRA